MGAPGAGRRPTGDPAAGRGVAEPVEESPLLLQTEALLRLLWDEDGEDRRADGAGMQPVQSP